MADQELKTLIAQGLQALKAGSEVAKKATAYRARATSRTLATPSTAPDGRPVMAAMAAA